MKKNMSSEDYNKISQNKDSEEYKNAHSKAASEVKNNTAGKKITRAVGNVWNSNAGKYIRKKAVPGGVAIALGSMALGASNPLLAFEMGKKAYQGVSEFSKTSTKNIAREAAPYVKGKTEEEKSNHVITTFQKGENGIYENSSDETKDLIKKLEAILIAMGQANKKDQIITNISRDLLKSPETFDLNDILTRAVGQENASNAKLQKATQAFADHKADGYLYNQLKIGDSMGTSLTTLANRIARESNNIPGYQRTNSSSQGSDAPSNPETPPASGDDNGSPIVVKQIVEHINKSEDIKQVINRVDKPDLDAAMRTIEDHIAQLEKATNQTQETTNEIEKFKKAFTQIKQRKEELESTNS